MFHMLAICTSHKPLSLRGGSSSRSAQRTLAISMSYTLSTVSRDDHVHKSPLVGSGVGSGLGVNAALGAGVVGLGE